MTKTKKMVFTALICAIAFVLTTFIRIPISSVPFLKYDPKDIIIVISGFVFGPATTVISTTIVSFIELFTISSTGIIGLIMNIISTLAFAATAAAIYKSNRTMKGAIVALILGVITQTAAMIIWNYAITPLYMELSREVVAKMLIPVFLPFNLIKGTLNAAFTLLLYKPFVKLMKALGILNSYNAVKKSSYLGVAVIAAVIISLCVVSIIILK